mmetsp:Transcript_58060/g.116685  ORF Transcript_58060/g.116685 Transcript_58060/m.116685 type:complete len:473 (+) Transcript_58060:762-2180(+)
MAAAAAGGEEEPGRRAMSTQKGLTHRTSKAKSSATTCEWSARGLKDTRTHTQTVPSLLGFTHRGTTANLRLDKVLLGPPSAPPSSLSSALASRGAFFDKRVGERTMNSLGCPSEPNFKGRNNAPPPLSFASSFASSTSFFPTLPAVSLAVLPLPLLLPAGSSSLVVQKKSPHDSATVAAAALALEKAFAAASSVKLSTPSPPLLEKGRASCCLVVGWVEGKAAKAARAEAAGNVDEDGEGEEVVVGGPFSWCWAAVKLVGGGGGGGALPGWARATSSVASKNSSSGPSSNSKSRGCSPPTNSPLSGAAKRLETCACEGEDEEEEASGGCLPLPLPLRLRAYEVGSEYEGGVGHGLRTSEPLGSCTSSSEHPVDKGKGNGGEGNGETCTASSLAAVAPAVSPSSSPSQPVFSVACLLGAASCLLLLLPLAASRRERERGLWVEGCVAGMVSQQGTWKVSRRGTRGGGDGEERA